MKKLPIGILTFSQIIKENCYYVDKTELVAKLLKEGTYFFCLVLEGLEKVFFLDTLREAFLGSKKLFTGLYLENNWNWDIKYPVIHISFGGGVIQKPEELEFVLEDKFSSFQREFSTI